MIGIKPKQFRPVFDDNASFLMQLADNGKLGCFALFHPATGKMPAGSIGMTDQQYTVVFIEHAALRAERQPARQAPIALKASRDDPGKRQSEAPY